MSIRLHQQVRRLLPISLAAVLLLSAPAVSAADSAAAVSGSGSTAVSATTVQSPAQETAADYALFLKDKFGIEFGDALAKGDFIAATAAALRLQAADEAEAATAADGAVFDDVPASSPYYAAAAALYREGIISGGTVNPQAPLRRSTPRRSRSRRPA